MLETGAVIWSGEGWTAMERALLADAATLRRGSLPATALSAIREHARQSIVELKRLQEGTPGSFPAPAGTSAADDAARGASTSAEAGARSSSSSSGGGRPNGARGRDRGEDAAGTSSAGARSSDDASVDAAAQRLVGDVGVSQEWAAMFIRHARRNGWHGAANEMTALHIEHRLPIADAWRATVLKHENGFGDEFLHDVATLSRLAPGQQEWVLTFAAEAARREWTDAVDDLVRLTDAGMTLPGAHRATTMRHENGHGGALIDDAIKLHMGTRGGESWAVAFAIQAAERGWHGAADDILRLQDDGGLPVRSALEAVSTHRESGLPSSFLDDVTSLSRDARLTPESSIATARDFIARGWEGGATKLTALIQEGVPVRDAWAATSSAYEHGNAAHLLDDVRELLRAGFSAEYAARSAQFLGETNTAGGARAAARLAERGFMPEYAMQVVDWAARRSGSSMSTTLARVEHFLDAGISPGEAVRLASAG